MTTLNATAHIGIVITAPSAEDIASIEHLIKMVMALVSFFILTWRELEPLILFVVSVVAGVTVAVKVVQIGWNVARFLV